MTSCFSPLVHTLEIPEMKEAYGESLREDTFQGIGMVASGDPGIVSERMFLDVMFDLTLGAKPSMKTSLERLVNRVKKGWSKTRRLSGL